MKRQLIAICGALLLAVLLTPFCLAQSQPAAPPRTQITIVRVKPEMAAEYRECLLKDVLPAYQKAGVKERSVWVRAIFGEAYEYAFGAPIENMAQFDNPSLVVKALGQEAVTALNAKRNRMTESARNFIVQGLPELSIARTNTSEPPKLAVATTTSVAPGRGADYEAFQKNDVLPILKKAGSKGRLMSRVVLGGDLTEYLTLSLFDSFADYEKFEQALAKVEGYNKLGAKTAGIVLHRENAVWRYVPELSLPQAPAKPAGK